MTVEGLVTYVKPVRVLAYVIPQVDFPEVAGQSLSSTGSGSYQDVNPHLAIPRALWGLAWKTKADMWKEAEKKLGKDT